MSNEKLQEEMFQSMRRIRRFHFGELLKDMSEGEYKTLEILSKCEACKGEDGSGVSAMAASMKVSPPAVSRLLKNMEAKGYIRRSVDLKDRRNTRVEITQEGIEKREACRKMNSEFTNRVIERMTPEKMTEMLKLFNQMVDIMEDEVKKTEKGDGKC